MPEIDLSPVAQALGRIPSGLFIVTTGEPERPLGFLASFVQQAGFEPPTVCVAIARGRDHLEAVRATERFAVSIVDAASSGTMTPFFKPGGDPFAGLATATTAGGSTVLSDCLAWLDCRYAGEHATGDHVIVFGEVVDAALLRTGDPKVHLRRNGLSY